MKKLYVVMVLFAMIGVTTTVKAAQCSVNGGAWLPISDGGTRLLIPVNVRVGTDTSRILLEGANVQCRFTPGGLPHYVDYWDTVPSVWVPGPKFSSQGTGLRINGTDRNTPVPVGIRIATIPNNGVGVPISVVPYILLRNNPTNPIDVRAGDVLGTLTLDQTNNYDSTRPRLILTYSANNNFTVSPSTCTINGNNPINIDFGNVHQRAIGTDPLTSTVTRNQQLTYSCPDGGINTDITITYKGTPASFNRQLLTMSNADVGTALVRGGVAVPVNEWFRTRINNSVGSDNVTFSLVRRGNSLPAAGPINGSGVLVMGIP